MKGTALHYDPETETVAASPPTSPVHREEVPIDPTVAATLNAAKSLESIDKSVATIKRISVFFLVITIIGIVSGIIAAVAR
jgi:hypothetical protein